MRKLAVLLSGLILSFAPMAFGDCILGINNVTYDGHYLSVEAYEGLGCQTAGQPNVYYMRYDEPCGEMVRAAFQAKGVSVEFTAGPRPLNGANAYTVFSCKFVESN